MKAYGVGWLAWAAYLYAVLDGRCSPWLIDRLLDLLERINLW